MNVMKESAMRNSKPETNPKFERGVLKTHWIFNLSWISNFESFSNIQNRFDFRRHNFLLQFFCLHFSAFSSGLARLRFRIWHLLWYYLVVLFGLGGPLFSTVSWAHDPGLSIAPARLSRNALSIQLGIAPSDLQGLLTLDASRNGLSSEPQLRAALPRLREIASQAFEINSRPGKVVSTNPTVQLDKRNGIIFDLAFAIAGANQLTIHSLLLEKLPRG